MMHRNRRAYLNDPYYRRCWDLKDNWERHKNLAYSTRNWPIDQLTKNMNLELPSALDDQLQYWKDVKKGEGKSRLRKPLGHMLCWFLLLSNSIRKYHNKNEAEMDAGLIESKTCLPPWNMLRLIYRTPNECLWVSVSAFANACVSLCVFVCLWVCVCTLANVAS